MWALLEFSPLPGSRLWLTNVTLSGGEGSAHELRKQAMQRLLEDDDARRDYLLRQSMFESVREAAAEEEQMERESKAAA